ncbi:putative mitochondrial protein [Vitis vinifera]|uniref:Putative mitochondrial protein n=1 Tax=Vitis vinifera TaxID=29760 RepID=A0A438CL05_VITVI|nr:putative mitochondrial protein [Vitis vinifera]
MKDLDQIHHFLGIEISQTSDGLHLSQSHYALTILERANMVDCKPMSTPLEAKIRTSSNEVLLEDPSYFRGLVGALQYLTLTRPDLSYSVNNASQFMHAPIVVHLKMIGQVVQPHDDPSLDIVCFLEEISSPDLHIPLASTPTLYCDDTSALHMTINLVFHARSKHIELDYHFVREQVALGLLFTQHISTEKQVANLFTKPMSKAALSNFQTKLCLQPQHSLREGIGITQHLGVNCGTQRNDKVKHNYGSDKVDNSHNSCYNSGETLKNEGVSMTTTSTRNEPLILESMFWDLPSDEIDFSKGCSCFLFRRSTTGGGGGKENCFSNGASSNVMKKRQGVGEINPIETKEAYSWYPLSVHTTQSSHHHKNQQKGKGKTNQGANEPYLEHNEPLECEKDQKVQKP